MTRHYKLCISYLSTLQWLLDVVCCLGWILPLWSEARGAVICALLKNTEHLFFSTCIVNLDSAKSTWWPEASCAREEVSAEECDRMLLWLWSLLSLPPPQPSTSSRPSRPDFSKISTHEWLRWDTLNPLQRDDQWSTWAARGCSKRCAAFSRLSGIEFLVRWRTPTTWKLSSWQHCWQFRY